MGPRLDPFLHLTGKGEFAGIPRPLSDPDTLEPSTRSISLSSNDYLGLSHHPAVVAAATAAIAEYGVGSAGTRGVAADRSIFERLEEQLAEFKGFEAALVFQSGYAANVGMIPALVGEGDLMIRDERSHASSGDGARLSGARVVTYRHRDVGHLEDILRLDDRRVRRGPLAQGRVMIVTDGVFGMEGDIAPLTGICDVAERYGAAVAVDDAHATGVLGRDGRGTVDHFGLGDRVDIHVGTLSKALGAMGGFVGARRHVRDHLVHTCHPTLYSTLPPSGIAAACIAALGVLRSEPGRLQRLWANTGAFRSKLAAAGFATAGCETPIMPIYLPSPDLTLRFAARLRDEGVIVQPITHALAVGQRPRLRLIVRSELSDTDLGVCADALEQVGRELHVLPG